MDDDRISNLPDALLSHILSFLPTKYAVASTLLSTRWKYLFSSLPNLDFDDSLLLQSGHGVNNNIIFTNFVYRVLLLRKSLHLSSFRLSCSADSSHINAWIHAALWRNVENLDIKVNIQQELCKLPRDIFTCGTLVTLKLHGEFILSNGFSAHLPNLKALHLSYITFTNDDSIGRVFSGCPLLQELKLFKSRLVDVQVLDISIPSLKSLVLHCCGGKYQFVLRAPLLEYFEYLDYVVGGYLVKDLKSLVNAHLDVELTKEQVEEDSLYYGSYVANLVNEISGVKFLHLAGASLEAIDYSGCSLPLFQQLTHLELGVNLNGCQLLPNLLESCPILEVLVFAEGFIGYNADKAEFHYHFPESVPFCLSRHLKEVKIRDFGGEEVALILIEYFLKSGQVLKKMTIEIRNYLKSGSHIRERLLAFPRCSKTCQIYLFTAGVM